MLETWRPLVWELLQEPLPLWAALLFITFAWAIHEVIFHHRFKNSRHSLRVFKITLQLCLLFIAMLKMFLEHRHLLGF
jgi:glucose dehydrogenase